MNVSKHDDSSAELALIERCRQQDSEAFGRFIDAYQARVYGFVKRMAPQGDDAADLTQEVFIRAFKSFGRFDGRSSVRTWLFRIAHNLCIDRARKYNRALNETPLYGVYEAEEDIEVPDERWEPEQFVLDAELIEAVESAMQAMSEKLRSVLLLHDREDMQYEEIASLLDIPVGTVKSRLFLARAYLQKALTPYLQSEVN